MDINNNQNSSFDDELINSLDELKTLMSQVEMLNEPENNFINFENIYQSH